MSGIDFAALAAAAAENLDCTVETEGGFERELPEAGICLVRLREYIEMGLRETKTATYPNKKPGRKVRFVFELVTPKHVLEFEQEDKTVKRIPQQISITVVQGTNKKSNFIKLFKQLNWDGSATHPAQLIGRAFLAEIVYGWKKGDDPEKTKPSYANLQKDGVYTFQPPRKVDPLAGTAEDLIVPELLGDKKLFLWDLPTKECWDSLFIDGTREKDGKEVSKNWVQEMLLEALDLETSPLFQMLNGGELDLPTSAEGNDSSDASQPTAETASSDAPPVTDPLAGLGLKK